MIRIEAQRAFEVYIQEAYDNWPDSGAISFEYFVSNLSMDELERLWHGACLWQLEQAKEAIRKL